ncbi:MAG: DUF4367 domain-containing protein [Chloroflexi bacterium]|nr:DUF4367 domain-containing protein [Chloroflexota bacterium]
MNETEFEKQLLAIAKGMEYPRTPDIAGSVTARLRSSTRLSLRTRPLAWSLTILLILLSSLMLIPPARAAILEFIQIGIVRIFPGPAQAPATATLEPLAPTTATPSSQPSTLLTTFLNQIAGETKLANAQEIAGYPILLPSYPPEMGLPNHVYVQDANGPMTILVWVDAQQPERVTLSLHFTPEGSWAIEKFQPAVIQEAEVNGQRAIWAEGPYPLRLSNGNMEFVRLIDGHVLIWEEGGITYRLETDMSLEEAVKIAESLQPIP